MGSVGKAGSASACIRSPSPARSRSWNDNAAPAWSPSTRTPPCPPAWRRGWPVGCRRSSPELDRRLPHRREVRVPIGCGPRPAPRSDPRARGTALRLHPVPAPGERGIGHSRAPHPQRRADHRVQRGHLPRNLVPLATVPATSNHHWSRTRRPRSPGCSRPRGGDATACGGASPRSAYAKARSSPSAGPTSTPTPANSPSATPSPGYHGATAARQSMASRPAAARHPAARTDTAADHTSDHPNRPPADAPSPYPPQSPPNSANSAHGRRPNGSRRNTVARLAADYARWRSSVYRTRFASSVSTSSQSRCWISRRRASAALS